MCVSDIRGWATSPFAIRTLTMNSGMKTKWARCLEKWHRLRDKHERKRQLRKIYFARKTRPCWNHYFARFENKAAAVLMPHAYYCTCNGKRLDLWRKEKSVATLVVKIFMQWSHIGLNCSETIRRRTFPIKRRVDSILFYFKNCPLFQIKNDFCKTFNELFFLYWTSNETIYFDQLSC